MQNLLQNESNSLLLRIPFYFFAISQLDDVIMARKVKNPSFFMTLLETRHKLLEVGLWKGWQLCYMMIILNIATIFIIVFSNHLNGGFMTIHRAYSPAEICEMLDIPKVPYFVGSRMVTPVCKKGSWRSATVHPRHIQVISQRQIEHLANGLSTL